MCILERTLNFVKLMYKLSTKPVLFLSAMAVSWDYVKREGENVTFYWAETTLYYTIIADKQIL